MKNTLKLFVILLCSSTIFAQHSGNINYSNQLPGVTSGTPGININYPSNSNMYISVKGLANVKADAYVAIFNVTQMGKTAKEVNQLIDARINPVLETINSKSSVETYIDMVSFVPMYEYEVERKIFSKKTYNEIPIGFELKKNIHIKYTDPGLLNEIIAALASSEIYDLVRVDYFSNELDQVKNDLMLKAKMVLQTKIKNYQEILSVNFDAIEKTIIDDYLVVYPVEMYNSYQAYTSTSLNIKKSANVNKSGKSTTLYYQPIVEKEYDFVLNPTIFEPVIQVMYEVKLVINREEYKRMKQQTKTVVQKPANEYFFLTPNGELKKLNITN
ncbi:MAG: DUF541 domain-containing protein [Crocinitomix sp.]|nr:DUF541 domain-containing protein [Crocinitomix sp.]